MSKVLLDRSSLARLLDSLVRRAYRLVGPKVSGAAITYQPIASIDDLPSGWTSAQHPGQYRLTRGDDERCFAYGPAMESLKRLVVPPRETLWTAARHNGTLRFEPSADPPTPLAVVGARPCELAALARLDAVFLGGPTVDPAYARRRRSLFLIAANCTEPGETCFCASMGTGPRADGGFDVALTELPGGRFVADVASAPARELIADVPCADADAAVLDEERAALERAARRMGCAVETDGLPAALSRAFDHPEWQAVARRCLACANCTIVCPTCFCHTIEDRTSLSGDGMWRDRCWDSCFGAEFSYIHGGSIRASLAARYRQWLMHKFSAWTEQFGTFGCVGCGRCITWCPAGIDVTEEIRRITLAEPAVAGSRT